MAELSVPQVDFSALGQLPAIYKQGQADQLRQQTLASLGQGGTADASALLKSGDLSLAQLGINMQNHQDTLRQQEIANARQSKQDQVANAHQKIMESIALRQAARADEGPVEQAGYREKVAAKYGMDINNPDVKAWIAGAPATATGGVPQVGLQPAYGVGADGKPAAVQFSNTGKAVQTTLPDGFSFSKEPIKMDLGTHIQLIDPITRQPIGQPYKKDIAGAEAAKEEGSAQGLAKVALPQTLAASEQILKTIDQVQKHPGKQYGLGLWSKAPTIPGTPQADFRAAADQLNGQTFLQAYQTLRGGGAITDIEGAKGTAALARMSQAQSEKAYDAALNDFKQVVKSGMDRAKAKAGASAAPAPSGGVVDYSTYFGH